MGSAPHKAQKQTAVGEKAAELTEDAMLNDIESVMMTERMTRYAEQGDKKNDKVVEKRRVSRYIFGIRKERSDRSYTTKNT